MKRWCLFLIFGGVSGLLASEKENKKKSSFEQFSSDLEKFYVEPGWVISSLVKLSIDDFDKAWELFVTTIRMNPWKFFVNKKDDYSDKKYREQFIAQCDLYDQFLRDLLVDVQNKRLILATGTEKKNYLKESGVITMFQYWQAKKITSYHHFYAFYFDQMAAQLIETITNGYCQHDTTDYPVLYKKAKVLLSELGGIFKRLRGGDYDGRYAYHLKRYKEVLAVLQQERKLQEGGTHA